MDWEAPSINSTHSDDNDDSLSTMKWTSSSAPLSSSSPITTEDKGKQIRPDSTTFREVLQVFTGLDDRDDIDVLLADARHIAVTSYPCASRAVTEINDSEFVALVVTRAVKSFLSKMTASNKKQFEALLRQEGCRIAELEEDMLSFEGIFEKLWYQFWSDGRVQYRFVPDRWFFPD